MVSYDDGGVISSEMNTITQRTSTICLALDFCIWAGEELDEDAIDENSAIDGSREDKLAVNLEIILLSGCSSAKSMTSSDL